MAKNSFVDQVKQKLTPNFAGGFPGWGQSPTTGSVIQPKQGLTGPARQLSLTEIMRPGGSQGIVDLSSDYWFGPLQPIQPVAPASYRPRQRAFLPGENIVWTPGDDKGGVTYEMLRAMADSWDLVRLVIETRKDQLSRMEWIIQVKGKPGEKVKDRRSRQQNDPNVKTLTDFFMRPDGYHSFTSWVRMWMEDVLVLDAGALYYQRDLDGKIANVMPLDGGTINRLLNDQGTTPQPPSAAYQQIVYGTPAIDLTTQDLQYIMRNERTWRRYGFSPVEQLIVLIGIGLRRESFLLEYYTAGNMPEGLCFLPSNIPIQKVKDIQGWFDSVLAGNLATRRRLTFLPGYGSGSGSDNVRPNVVFPKEKLLVDEADDWLMRLVCYAFSVSPQNLMKQMNRASAQQASDVAEEEGMEPSLNLVAEVCNNIINELGMSDLYEFTWQEKRETDPLKQAQIENLQLGKIYSTNEIRDHRGDDLRSEPQADMLGQWGPQGFIPIDTPPPTQPPAGKPFGKVDEYVHPVYGDLSSYNEFFAYDPETDVVLVKGDVDVNEAVKQLKLEGMYK